jgi:hypothetical protein
MPKQDIAKAIKKAKDILTRKGDEIKKKYSVNGMGIGFKTENGKLTDKVAFVFYVKKKKNKYEGGVPVPNEIDGIPTDIVEVPNGFRAR